MKGHYIRFDCGKLVSERLERLWADDCLVDAGITFPRLDGLFDKDSGLRRTDVERIDRFVMDKKNRFTLFYVEYVSDHGGHVFEMLVVRRDRYSQRIFSIWPRDRSISIAVARK